MKKALACALCLLLLASLLDCSKKKEEAPKPGTQTATADIVDIALGDGRFSTFNRAIEAAGLVETLKGAGPITVFAPSDSAFAKLPVGAFDGLLQDVPQLKAILLYHVAPGRITAADIPKTPETPTMLGPAVTLMVAADGRIIVGGAAVEQADIEASNGVIHLIDRVLIPPPPPPVK